MLEFMDIDGVDTDATDRKNVCCNYHFHYPFEFLIVWEGEVKAKISGKEYLLSRGEQSAGAVVHHISDGFRSYNHPACFSCNL